MSTSKKNSDAASGSDTELSKDQKLASETKIVRLRTALDAKPSSPELLLKDTDADARMLDGGGGYGAPEADARMLGGGGGAWDANSSRAASQQGMLAPPPIRPPGTFGPSIEPCGLCRHHRPRLSNKRHLDAVATLHR